jgi:hypothetical protein
VKRTDESINGSLSSYGSRKWLLSGALALISFLVAISSVIVYRNREAVGPSRVDKTIMLIVEDATTLRPISNAMILSKAGGIQVVTDFGGKAQLKLLSADEVFITAPGYQSSAVRLYPADDTAYRIELHRNEKIDEPRPDSNSHSALISSGPVLSGERGSFSGWYEVTAPAPPTGYVYDLKSSKFRLEGDRSCGQWAECSWGDQSPTKLSFRFRLQGHSESPGRGQTISQGVLEVAYKLDSFDSMYTLPAFRKPHPRHWQRYADGSWGEFYDGGISSHFADSGKVVDGDCSGTLLTKHGQPSGQVFMPSSNCKQILKYRWNGGSWQEMGPIQR